MATAFDDHSQNIDWGTESGRGQIEVDKSGYRSSTIRVLNIGEIL